MSFRNTMLVALSIGLLFVSCASCQSGGGASSSDGSGSGASDIGSGGGASSDVGSDVSGSGAGGGAESASDGGIGSSDADTGGTTGIGSAEGSASGQGAGEAGPGEVIARDAVLMHNGETSMLLGREADMSRANPVPDQGARGSRNSFWIVDNGERRTQIDMEAPSKAQVTFTPDCSGYAVLYEQGPDVPGWAAYDLGYLTMDQAAQISFLSGQHGTYSWYVNICDSWSRPLTFNVW